MVAVNCNKVFISSISLASLHVSASAGHLQVNTIVFFLLPLTDPLFRLLLHILSLVILYNILIKITDIMFSKFTSNMALKLPFYI
jgi:hypothetical protein